MIVAVIPAKDLTDAKARLSSCLAPIDRRLLFSAMLEDVLVAVRSAPSIGRVLVVTREPALVRVAQAHGAIVCLEPANQGHTAAVRFAVDQLRSDANVDAMLTLPGDVPLVTADEIEVVVAASPLAPSVVFVPSRSGLGTNGVLLRPLDAMALRFGEPSFPNHVKVAEDLGLARRILELPGFGLDIDTGSDLTILRSRECGPHTQRVLDEMAVRGAFQPADTHAH